MSERVDTHGLPRLVVRDRDAPVRDVLREAQYALLKHPVAAQAAFASLVAEGRRFAATPEGRGWAERLASSELMREGRTVWEVATLQILEEEPANLLPSTYVDALVKATSSPELESLLARLFDSGEDAAGVQEGQGGGSRA